jgi:5'-nucleotidase
MAKTLTHKLVVCISSRALFDLSDSHAVYEEQGVDAYQAYQIAHENEPLLPGGAFALVKKLLRMNELHDNLFVEIVLLSRNSADTGLRIFNSIAHYGLSMTRAVFTGGSPPYEYARNFGSHLFLSADLNDVRMALEGQLAAAVILPSSYQENQDAILRIAFDGDAVLFSDESERIYQEQSLEAFTAHEVKRAEEPMLGGPFKAFLSHLAAIQALYTPDTSPIRTALVTARSAPTHERVIRTLRAWNIRIDEALFLGGLDKAGFLRSFGADIFFDDQQGYCERAAEHVATGHVPHGVINT